jgi:Holliday junction DNA helicase RuvA
MIGYIEGKVIAKDERGVIILTRSGVGYLVSVNKNTFEKIEVDSDYSLWIHTVVREDTLDLFGFKDESDLKFFKLLTSVSGIGPRSALNILSLADLATIIHAITNRDASYLTKVSGIGKKNAEKIIIELCDKLDGFNFTNTESQNTSNESEALLALESLGYNMRDTRQIVREIAKEDLSTQDIIKAALKQLGR